MAPITRSVSFRSTASNVQGAALSILRAPLAQPPSRVALQNFDGLYHSDEDYDSDQCTELPLSDRVSSKLRSAAHAAWVDLMDDDGNFPHDDGHNLATVESTLEALAEFLVEVEEALVWWRETDTRYGGTGRTDTQTFGHMYRTLAKHGRKIGTRMMLELKMICDTYVSLYRGLDEHRRMLGTSLLVRRVRTSSAAEARATRMELTEQTTGEQLLQRLEVLKQKIDATLVQCGEQV